jgi:hypothetical protein
MNKEEFSFKLAFLHYGGLWSSLRLCPGVKYVEAAKEETILLDKGYYVFRVVTDKKGIKIPAFQYDIFKTLIDNGWTYDRSNTEPIDNIFTCLGDDCFNKQLIPPVSDAEIVYVV